MSGPTTCLLSLVGLSLIACGDPPDNTTTRRDTRDTGTPSDTTTADSTDTGPDEVELLVTPPSFEEYRPNHDVFWNRAFYMEADGRHFITVVDTQRTPVDHEPRWRLARVDTATLEAELGDEVDPATNLLQAFPTATPGVLWVYGDGGPTLRTLDLAAAALGPTLDLPSHDVHRQVTWTWDFSFAAYGFGTRTDEGHTAWHGVILFALPPDPRAFDPATVETRELSLPPADSIYLRVTSGGRHLAIADAPYLPQPEDCLFCTPEVDVAAGRFRLFDLADLAEPLIETRGYDGSFRVSTRGRWLYRDNGAGAVVAIDLDDPVAAPRYNLPCRSPGKMSLGDDDEILCIGDVDGTTSLVRIGPDLDVIASVPVANQTAMMIVGPDRRRVLVGDQVFELVGDEIATLAVPWPEEASSIRYSDGRYVWDHQPLAAGPLVRMSWADLTAEVLPLDGARLIQVEGLADGGFAVVDIEDFDSIVVHEADGTVRGTFPRVPAAP